MRLDNAKCPLLSNSSEFDFDIDFPFLVGSFRKYGLSMKQMFKLGVCEFNCLLLSILNDENTPLGRRVQLRNTPDKFLSKEMLKIKYDIQINRSDEGMSGSEFMKILRGERGL